MISYKGSLIFSKEKLRAQFIGIWLKSLRFLKTEIEQLSGQKLICMQNFALNHHILAVRISLKQRISKWLDEQGFEKGEPTPKPPRSLDLTPGLFFWGFSKNIVYADKIQKSMHLR